ncbi:uncharacterized protein BT62DRAFT_935982 [Guyanagaster necrorhizus]|uniref:Uncharacterized protein n=1 Tax=Guyanagaster necrorhizus TaxID=856835 RepID=A0A9P7VM11_9AGAR|nr:uncharacterized protein BT62DRAFT_935982 [Guyanagaster necrorhizus MCA 3950]KAG7442421.1 hypothetical protein BT62DRAFT_935982 [Guyanagaster necrorhizus MCA 3950]
MVRHPVHLRLCAFPGLSGNARSILEQATPGAPHWVVYADAYTWRITGPPAVSEVRAYEWTTLTSSETSAIKSEYAAASISLIVSAFGSTNVPTTTGADPVATANTMAAWDFYAMNSGTTELRVNLPLSAYIISHARLLNGYLKVHVDIGNLIHWYDVQVKGDTEYTTCSGLLTTSSETWPQTALFQIANSGVPLEKLVIGKPTMASDAGSGYMTISSLETCLQDAKNQG